MNKKGFTLVELLVVIVIIGILATLATVALGSARMKARDARRVSDIKQIQTAMELFYNDNQAYPTAGEFLVGSALVKNGVTYMAKVPNDPLAGSTHESTCNGATATYTYTIASVPATVGYVLQYCLGGATGGIAAGTHCATLKGVDATGAAVAGNCTTNP